MWLLLKMKNIKNSGPKEWSSEGLNAGVMWWSENEWVHIVICEMRGRRTWVGRRWWWCCCTALWFAGCCARAFASPRPSRAPSFPTSIPIAPSHSIKLYSCIPVFLYHSVADLSIQTQRMFIQQICLRGAEEINKFDRWLYFVANWTYEWEWEWEVKCARSRHARISNE